MSERTDGRETNETRKKKNNAGGQLKRQNSLLLYRQFVVVSLFSLIFFRFYILIHPFSPFSSEKKKHLNRAVLGHVMISCCSAQQRSLVHFVFVKGLIYA